MQPKSSRVVAPVYAYIVCLVAVIIFLFAFSSFVGALFDLSDPLHATNSYSFGYYQQPNLSSFEAYRLDVVRGTGGGFTAQGREPLRPLTAEEEAALPRMYEAARADRIGSVRLQAYRTLTISGLFCVISVLMFITHWKWVRRLTNDDLSTNNA